MKKSLLSVVAGAALVLAACGSDSGASGPQAEAADAAIEAASKEGLELDKDCANKIASELSDEDAKAIADAGADGDPDVSAEGEAIGAKLLSCADNSAVVDFIIKGMKDSGQAFDEQCVRDSLEGVDLADLAASGDNAAPPEEVMNALTDCVDLGS
jgi:hypothetical protein